ncbi:class I SAM-dependent methyltransferase [Sphingosinicella sp.]|uniref:class I SAM-dependent methyltransferase n=1 Tax=Sphingosinicella sp. TaxID=1917971 RepID=UPI0035B2786C
MNVTPSTVSLERLVPNALDGTDATGKETLALHMERYRFAAGFVKGGRVLDCACGVGYGTAVLAGAEQTPEQVLGVDIDAAAVGYAARSYISERVRFLQSDGCKLEDSDGFDTIVSLETVEHVPDPSALLQNFRRLLRPGGTLIASVPVTPSVDVNPYHLHDFTPKSFRSLGADLGLKEIDSLFQVQPFSPLKIVRGQEARLEDMRKNMAGYYLRNPAAFSKRLISTVVDGFCNKYLTIAWVKPISA